MILTEKVTSPSILTFFCLSIEIGNQSTEYSKANGLATLNGM